jgi:hypothetical protein
MSKYDILAIRDAMIVVVILIPVIWISLLKIKKAILKLFRKE